MAPKAGTKRGRPVKDAPKSKAAKIEKPKVDPMLEGVLDAVDRAELPESCKQMLMVVAPGSLSVGASERHSAQEAVVGMIEDMFEGIKTKMTADVEEQNGLVATADSKKEELARVVTEVESRLTAAKALSDEKAQLLESADKVVKEKLELLEAAKTQQVEGDKALEPLQTEKDQYVAAFDAEFKFMLEGETREQGEVKKQYDVVKPLIDKLGLDDSLAASLLAVVEKAPSTRGSFDSMVVEQLTQKLKKKISKLEEELVAGEAGKVERAAGVDKAQAEVDKAQADQAEAKSEHTAASEAVTAVTAELGTAQAALSNFESEHKEAGQALDAKTAALQKFKEWNVECFTTLKNKSSDSKEVAMDEDAEKTELAPVEHAGA